MPWLRNIVDRFKALDPRRRMIVAVLAGLILLLIIFAAAMAGLSQSAAKREAVQESAEAANGFDKDSDSFTFTQLNKAVEFAGEKKCVEARAVYDDAVSHTNGLPESDVTAYKKRIEDLCSGKATPPAANRL